MYHNINTDEGLTTVWYFFEANNKELLTGFPIDTLPDSIILMLINNVS